MLDDVWTIYRILDVNLKTQSILLKKKKLVIDT